MSTPAPLKKKHIEKTLTEAMALHQSGDIEQAATLYHAILGADPKDPNALLNLSTLESGRGNYAQAETLIKRLIVTQPKLAYGHFALGNLLLKQQKFLDAAASFARAATLDPSNASYSYNRGTALDAAGHFEEALEAYARVFALQPSHYEARVNRINALYHLQRYQEAVTESDAVIALQPNLPLAYTARGNALGALGRTEEALADYERALELDPTLAMAHNNCGSLLEKHPDRQEDAIKSYDAAIALNPNYADAHINRATSLNRLRRYAEAIESCNQALAINPHSANAYDTRGNAYAALRRFGEAQADYDQALALKPDIHTVPWNLALMLLLQGNLEQGLKHYEGRWRTEFMRDDIRTFPQPLWLGQEDITGKTAFVWHEQGFGDFIQMFRYIPLLAAKAQHVYLETQHAMMDLVAPVLPKNVSFIEPTQAPASFDYHVPIMSLQLAFQTTLETIPRTIPYLTALAEKRAKWHAILGPKTKPRIGLVWSGAALHTNDHNRSIPLKTLEPLLSQPAYEFHSLQKEVRARDMPSFPLLADHREQIEDFADTAALISELDLVISVDTSVAHLAGALGCPLWVLLPHTPDYRWLLHREDSVWYPQARLFRQPAQDDWPNVIAAVIEAANTHFQTRDTDG